MHGFYSVGKRIMTSGTDSETAFPARRFLFFRLGRFRCGSRGFCRRLCGCSRGGGFLHLGGQRGLPGFRTVADDNLFGTGGRLFPRIRILRHMSRHFIGFVGNDRRIAYCRGQPGFSLFAADEGFWFGACFLRGRVVVPVMASSRSESGRPPLRMAAS